MNVLGIALSLACIIVIFRYVYEELTVERFNAKLDRIYVVTSKNSRNPEEIHFLSSFPLVKEKHFDDMMKHSGVDCYSNFISLDNQEIVFDNRKYTASLLVADSNFLTITDYPIIFGTSDLSNPNSALVTKRFAHKLFGNDNPVGKSVQYLNGNMLTITGIIGEASTKSLLSFDMIVSFYFSRWTQLPQSYVLLFPDVDCQSINKQYENVTDLSTSAGSNYQLYPLSKVYFNKEITNYGNFKQGNYNNVIVMTAAGILILLIGIVNYVNIYTVLVLRRSRELSIKKVFGASSFNIFKQLFIENILMVGFAIALALFCSYLLNPLITNRLQLDQIPNIRFDLILCFSLLLSLPVITTLFPFFQHRYSSIVTSLHNIDIIRGIGSLRFVFLSFQYFFSTIMIIMSLFFIKQHHFMLNFDLGYQTKNIIKVQFQRPNNSDLNKEQMLEYFSKRIQIGNEIEQKMNACPLFTNWTYHKCPTEMEYGSLMYKVPDGENKDAIWAYADENWFKLFNIQLKEGQFWSDEARGIIVNESFLKLLGITDFNHAILQSSRIDESVRIVGVVKDFNYLHLSQRTKPVAFYFLQGSNTNPLIASIVPGRMKESIDFLRNLHNETVGGEFAYSFVEDEVRSMYKEDNKIASIYSIFTFIAILISSLGLFSMSLFDIQQRRKEIAIRKINGATFHDIIKLLLKRYFLFLTLSFVIAIPVSLFAIQRYLEDFSNKAPIAWWLFAVAVTLTSGISLLTLITQTKKAAAQNPAVVVKGD